MPNWPSCFLHPKLQLFLAVYVDDFKMAGPVQNLEHGWKLIREEIDMDDPAPKVENNTVIGSVRYLGCVHEFDTTDGSSKEAR